MGRRRALATTSGLPRYVYKRRASYYFRPPIGVRRWIPLGPDLSAALVRYVELVCDTPETQHTPAKLPMSFGELAEVYVVRELPRKAPASQRGNWVDLSNLRPVFDAVALDDISPVDIRSYLDLRGQVTEVRANREIALFSHMWNRAREWGFTQLANPCVGVRKFKEMGRDIYVSDADLKAVWNAACWPVQDMLDIAYLLGQRPQDVYALTLDKIDEELVSIQQLKTGRKIRIENEGELTQVLARIRLRVRRPGVRALVVNERGEAFTPGMFKKRFNKARNAAGVQFQLRDLRAKNATDTDDLALAQKRLAHASRAMTEHYVRQRLGEKVKPLNRKITGD